MHSFSTTSRTCEEKKSVMPREAAVRSTCRIVRHILGIELQGGDGIRMFACRIERHAEREVSLEEADSQFRGLTIKAREQR